MEPEGTKDKAAFVHHSSFIDEGAIIESGVKIWHFCHVMGSAHIANNVVLGQGVFVGNNVCIGEYSKIQNNVSIFDGVVIADRVFCGPSCVFTNVSTPRAFINRKTNFKKTFVGSGASIGANATIICGNKLGAYCFVGAGALISTDVPNFGLMIGIPARRVGWVSRAGYRLGTDLKCPETGEQFVEVGENKLIGV